MLGSCLYSNLLPSYIIQYRYIELQLELFIENWEIFPILYRYAPKLVLTGLEYYVNLIRGIINKSILPIKTYQNKPNYQLA